MGNWKKDKRHGKGELYFEKGCKFIGEFRRGKFEGLGKLISRDKTRYYKGFWKDGKMDGVGEYMYGDGTMYSGEFENNQKHGFGVFIYNDGKKNKVVFNKDNLVTNNVEHFILNTKTLELTPKLNKSDNKTENLEIYQENLIKSLNFATDEDQKDSLLKTTCLEKFSLNN